MNQDKYVFAQLTAFLNRTQFNNFVRKYDGNRYVTFSIRLISTMSKNSIASLLKYYLIKFLTRLFLLDTNELLWTYR